MPKDMRVEIESNAFQQFRRNMNILLKGTLSTMQEKGSEAATISVRFDITLAKDFAPDTQMQYVGAEREICVPTFKHKIKSVIQLKADLDGEDAGHGYELIWDDVSKKYITRAVGPEQIAMSIEGDEDDEDGMEGEDDADDI